MDQNKCVSCKESAFTEIRKVFYCKGCFMRTIHKKIKRNVYLCSFRRNINVFFDRRKGDYVILHALNEIYFINSKSNTRVFNIIGDSSYLNYTINKEVDFELIKEESQCINEDASTPLISCLIGKSANELCFDGLKCILNNQPHKLRMLANNKITSKGIEFINVLENVTNKEIDIYYDLIKEKSVILKEEPKYEDKLTSLCNNFMNELEENNCGVFFNFLELLRKV